MNIKLAKAAVGGVLDGNSFCQGLLAQCLSTLEKQSRGISSTRGRSSRCNDTETRLIQEAALSLAVAGGNRQLATSLGQNTTLPRIHCDDLVAMSLPNPCLAIMSRSHMEENIQLAEQLFLRSPNSPVRRLIMGIDHTYLQRMIVQGRIRGKPGLIGGPWGPDDQSLAFLPFDSLAPDALKTKPAGMMLEALVWDPYQDLKQTISVASVPMSLQRVKPDNTTLVKQGNMEPRLCILPPILQFFFGFLLIPVELAMR